MKKNPSLGLNYGGATRKSLEKRNWIDDDFESYLVPQKSQKTMFYNNETHHVCNPEALLSLKLRTENSKIPREQKSRRMMNPSIVNFENKRMVMNPKERVKTEMKSRIRQVSELSLKSIVSSSTDKKENSEERAENRKWNKTNFGDYTFFDNTKTNSENNFVETKNRALTDPQEFIHELTKIKIQKRNRESKSQNFPTQNKNEYPKKIENYRIARKKEVKQELIYDARERITPKLDAKQIDHQIKSVPFPIIADQLKETKIQKEYQILNVSDQVNEIELKFYKIKERQPLSIEIKALSIPKIPSPPKPDQSLTEFINLAKELTASLGNWFGEFGIGLTIKKYRDCIVFHEESISDVLVWSFDGKFYLGGWKFVQNGFGFKEGKGLELSSNSFYQGHFREGKRNGIGSATFFNGILYQGSWVNGNFEGVGSLKSGNLTFHGNWKNGKMEGKGFIRSNSNYYYEGYFENNLKKGNGIEIFENGNVYEGEFNNNMIDGQGIYWFGNGTVFKGTFKNGEMNGVGLLLKSEVCKYDSHLFGNFVEGECSGYVISWSATTGSYIGYFYKDLKHGPGVISSFPLKDVIKNSKKLFIISIWKYGKKAKRNKTANNLLDIL